MAESEDQQASNDPEVRMLIHKVDTAPKAIGPYCHAAQVGNLVFCSGQTPLDPASMELRGASISKQTEQALRNLETVLAGLGLSLQDVIKTTVFLTDMSHFVAMNQAYERCFSGHTPARTTVAVKGLPMNALVEIECIAEAQP
jgi:2-iminobutanoate/2-iminopropanoate deaminase